MTRQRIRPSLESAVYNTCPYCEGRGNVKSPTSMAIQTLKDIRKAIGHSRKRSVIAYVHPDVSERLLDHERKSLHHLERVTDSRVQLFSEPSMHIEDVNITFVK